MRLRWIVKNRVYSGGQGADAFLLDENSQVFPGIIKISHNEVFYAAGIIDCVYMLWSMCSAFVYHCVFW